MNLGIHLPANIDLAFSLCFVPAMVPVREKFVQYCYDHCMKLADYLITQNLSPTAFAKRIGVGRMTIHRYIKGERQPCARITDLIYRATQGQVTAHDFWLSRMEFLNRDSSEPRKTYPWSRETAAEREAIEDAFTEMLSEPLEGLSLSPVLQEAISTLGTRAQAQTDGTFFLDGRLIRPVDLVKRANTVKKEQEEPLLRYPGA